MNQFVDLVDTSLKVNNQLEFYNLKKKSTKTKGRVIIKRGGGGGGGHKFFQGFLGEGHNFFKVFLLRK